MTSVRWGEGGGELEIHTWWEKPSALLAPSPEDPQDDYEWMAVTFGGLDEARQFMAAHVEVAPRLRQLLACEGDAGVFRLSDHQVLDGVASMLANRELGLVKKVLTAQAKARHQIHSVGAGGASAEAVSPSSLRSRHETAAEPLSEPVVNDVDFESVDQDIQAATLRLAAVDGVPFCEVCEKPKGEREPKADLQEAA